MDVGMLRNRRAHVALFLPSLRGGGVERVMVNIARGLSDRGIRVDFVVARAEGPFLREVASGVRVVDLHAHRVLASLPALVRYLRRERPDVLLSAMNHANLVALWAREIARVRTRVVVSVHGLLLQGSQAAAKIEDRGMPYLMRLFYSWADQVIAVSHGTARNLIESAGVTSDRIKVIYNPVLPPDLDQKAQALLDHPWFVSSSPPVVVSAGRLTKPKDFMTLLHALAELNRVSPVRLIILGEGPERPALMALAHRLGVERQVAMPGFVQNPYAYMSRAQVFVLSSARESFGNVLVEAMACGCPVVATDCPTGPSEILAAGEFGTLVPMGNAPALAAAIRRSLVIPPSRAQLRQRSSTFSLSSILPHYLAALGIAQEIAPPLKSTVPAAGNS